MKPLILLTNDDGITSPAIKELINVFSGDYEIVIIAPKHPQSAKGCSHAHGDSWVTIEKERIDDIDWITVDNSPATCISVALKFYKLKPDLVISGINHGENLGLNLFYSGTFGAAWEAAMSGFKSMAISLSLPSNMHFSMDKNVDFTASGYFSRIIAEMLLKDDTGNNLWNINIPTNANNLTEMRETNLGKERWNIPYIAEHQSSKKIKVRFEYEPTGAIFDSNSDVEALRSGLVSITKINQFYFPWT